MSIAQLKNYTAKKQLKNYAAAIKMSTVTANVKAILKLMFGENEILSETWHT